MKPEKLVPFRSIPIPFLDFHFHPYSMQTSSVYVSASAASQLGMAAEQTVGRINLKLSGIVGKCLETFHEFSPWAWGAPFARGT